MVTDARISQRHESGQHDEHDAHESWISEFAGSSLSLAKDAWRLTETGGENVLHDLHITNGPGSDAYQFSDFVRDHHTAVNYGIDCVAAVAGGATFVATSPFIGPGSIVAGAGAGAGVESGLHYLIGDQVTAGTAIRGAVMGAGAAGAMTLEAAVAARFGSSIAAWSERTLGSFSPAVEATASRVLMPATSAVTRPGFGQVAAFGADRARASLYSHVSTGTLKTVEDASQQVVSHVFGK